MQKRCSFRRLLALACLLAWLVPAWQAAGAVPGEINFQGLLLDSSGQPANGMVDLVFTLYASASGGSALWSESHSDVQVIDGVYDVALGSTTPIGGEVLEGGSLYLEVSVEGETLSPRQRLLAVPYALRSESAARADTAATLLAPVAQVPADNAIAFAEPMSDLRHISATIGADGLPVISYVRGFELRVLKCGDASCSSGNAVTTLLTSPSLESASIAIGADGFPVIAFTDSGGLSVAKCSDSSCAGDVDVNLGDAVGQSGPSIAIGVTGFPVISYVDAASHLKVMKCGDAACEAGSHFVSTSEVVDDATSIAIGMDGKFLIAFSGPADVRLARCTNAICTSLGAGTVSPGGESLPVLAVGDDGLPIIALFSPISVSVVSCSSWPCTMGPPSTTTTHTLDTYSTYLGSERRGSLVVGSDGVPMISYTGDLSASSFELKYIRCGASDCSSISSMRVLDSPGSGNAVGLFSSIVVGADGLPVIAYRDDENDELKVLRCANRLCLPYWTRR